MDCNSPDFSVHGILQARILEWVATPYSRGCSLRGSNLRLLHCREISLPLSHLGSPKLMVVVVIVAKLCPSLAAPWSVATRLLCPWDFPGKNTGAGCHFLLQEIFLTQGLNPGVLHCRQTLYHGSLQGSSNLAHYLTKKHFRNVLSLDSGSGNQTLQKPLL